MPRRVRTAEGSRYYDLPIGAPITAAAIAAARARNGGKAAPKGSTYQSSATRSPDHARAMNMVEAARRDRVARLTSPEISIKPPPTKKPKGPSVKTGRASFKVDGDSKTWSRPGSPVKYNLDSEGELRVFTPQGEAVLDDAAKAKVKSLLVKERSSLQQDETSSPDKPAADAAPSEAPAAKSSADKSAAREGDDSDPVERPVEPTPGVIDEDVPVPDESNVFEGMSGEGVEAAKKVYSDALLAEPQISKSMSDLAAEFGGLLKGFRYRVKGPGSLVRKIRTDADGDGVTHDEAASKIRDSVRYTMQFDNENFTESAMRVLQGLRDQGYTNFRIKNSLKDKGVAYRGINMTMANPDGVYFELQFHTPESLFVKMEGDPNLPANERKALHLLYEEWRELPKDSPRAQVLAQMMIALSDSIPTPPGIDLIGA